jgi:transcriptional regulator with GAF, ATPase, and Fis domain
MHRVMDLARRVAKVDSTVLITGENGVGKERIARLIHDESPRTGGAFVAINCGAVPETLLESELFGHAKGSFTGAAQDRPGLFEAANGGTLFLDEIGEVPPAMQVKLLRVLQEREVRRVGENKNRKVYVRVLAATNRDLVAEINAARFRQDLYYRLRVVELRVPPLRERREDILPLARRGNVPAGRRPGSPRARRTISCAIAGPATCANSRTRSSGPLSYRAQVASTRRTCRRRLALLFRARTRPVMCGPLMRWSGTTS